MIFVVQVTMSFDYLLISKLYFRRKRIEWLDNDAVQMPLFWIFLNPVYTKSNPYLY